MRLKAPFTRVFSALISQKNCMQFRETLDPKFYTALLPESKKTPEKSGAFIRFGKCYLSVHLPSDFINSTRRSMASSCGMFTATHFLPLYKFIFPGAPPTYP